jgi:hypothetical protein
MATATLLCKQCNFENEPERVYCHNCGAKLDRSLLPPEAVKREDPQTVQDRVRSVVQPTRPTVIPILTNLLVSLLVAAVLASLFLISEAPDGRPNLSDDAVLAAPPISDALEDLAQSPSPKRLSFTEDQVNAFLQSSLKAKENDSFGISLKYDRTFVSFQEGVCRATVEESIFGHPFYFSSTDQVEIKDGQVISHPVGGSIGRLQIPAKLMPVVDKALANMWSSLDPLKKLVARLGSITFQKGAVVVVGKSAGAS